MGATRAVGDRKLARVARALASPGGVLIIMPALIIATGVIVLLFGRSTTRETAETMARQQLLAQAKAVEHDVAFALDQANPVLATMRSLTDAAMPTEDVLLRLSDAVLGRPGVHDATITFPVGVTWGVYFDDTSSLRVFESRVGDGGTRTNYGVKEGRLAPIKKVTNSYDARTRPHYKAAVEARKRTWLPPRVFMDTGKTGLTVTEPVYGADAALIAVLTINYDIAQLSAFLRAAPLEGAQTVMFTSDGTILANSAAPVPRAALEKRLLRHSDFDDPALTALFATDDVARLQPREPRFLRVTTSNGDYLASIAAVGTQRADAAVSFEWYLATLVPESSLLGAMRRLESASIIASVVALAIAMAIALVFAWHLVRMRRTIDAQRQELDRERERANVAERSRQLAEALWRLAQQPQQPIGEGRTIDNRYRVIRRLGAGGMGTVYEAERTTDNQRVALKTLRGHVDHEVMARFAREAQIAAELHHPNLVPVIDIGVEDGALYLVMELIDGGSIEQERPRFGDTKWAAPLLPQIASGLAAIHERGIVHRDLKPGNILLASGVPRIADFGLASLQTSRQAETARSVVGFDGLGDTQPAAATPPLTRAGDVFGTPAYMAPELAVGARDAKPDSDVFAFGLIACEMLTGKKVFSEPPLVARLDGRAIPPPSLEEIEPTMRELVRRCVDLDPTKRPTAAELVAALQTST